MRSKVRYPYASAIAIAKSLSDRVKRHFPTLFCAVGSPTYDHLKKLATERDAVVVEDERIPGGREAVLMDVEGISYILLHKRLKRRRLDRSFYLGHELGHVLLEHQSAFVNDLDFPYSERPYTRDQELQVLYENQREIEANFFSMMLIAPDPFLDRIVSEKVYISAYNLADSLELSLNLAVARIELYRSMYGYENSYRAAARNSGNMDETRLVSVELPRGTHGLEAYLPEISSRLLAYIK